MITVETIERIVIAARRPLDKIVPRSIERGSDGNWHSPVGGFPRGVTPTGECETYYVKMRADGTTHGTRYPTEEAALEAQHAMQERHDAEFRAALTEMTPDRLQAQADYWLAKTK